MNRKIGFILCGLLALMDLAGLAGLWQHPGPPAAVAVTGAVLGVVTLAAYRPAERGDLRGVRVLLGSRIVSALLGLPVFFTGDAPGWARVVVAVALVVTAAAVAVLTPAARTAPAGQA
jgi:hypothetical protein